MNIPDLASLSYRARGRHLVDLGRRAQADPAVASLLERWRGGDWQERQWALLADFGTGDAAFAARVAVAPSASLARLAVRLLAVFGTDEQALEALRRLPHRRRARLLARLRLRRRQGPIDAFVRELPASEAARYQAFAAAPAGGHSDEWCDLASCRRRAVARPDETVARLVEALDAAEQPDGMLFRAARVALEALLPARPELSFRLLLSLRRHVPLGELPLRRLASYRPGDVADLVLTSSERIPVDLSPFVKKLGREQVVALLEKQPHALPRPERWLRDLPAEGREAIFEQVGEKWRTRSGALPLGLMAVLPMARRHEEARRHLKLKSLAARPRERAAYCGFLPWEKALAELQKTMQHPEAEHRAAAWAALSECVRFHGNRIGEFLAMVRAKKYEQDPVRLVFLTGLAEVQPGRWAEGHLPELAGAIREALDATDLSVASACALGKLVWRVMPRHPDWAAGQLVVLFRERGPMVRLPSGLSLSVSEAVRVDGALAPVYDGWRDNNRAGWLVWVAAVLGARLRDCPRLLAALRMVVFTEQEHLALAAFELLRRALPSAGLDTLVGELLERDRSWAAVTALFRVLYLRRQDLVGPFLRQRFVSGHRGRSDLLHLVPNAGHSRLTIGQQRALSETIAGLMELPPGDKMPADSWTVLGAITLLSRLPEGDHSRLVELAGDGRPLVRDAALRALGRLDVGKGLPTLLEALGDDRARVAIYALRAAVADLPGERVLEMLRGVSFRKATVAKEVLRLVGEFGGAGAFAWLLETAGRDLHRDVRIALLRSLWDHLEREESWGLLEGAAQEPDGRLLDGVLRIPGDNLSAASRARLVELLTGLTRHPEPTVRVAALERFAALPVPDPKHRLLERSLEVLGSPLPDERRAAAAAVLAVATPASAGRVAAATGRILASRQALWEWLQALTAAAVDHRGRLGEVARAVLAALRPDPLTVCLQPALAASADGLVGLRELLRAWRDGGGAGPHGDALRALETALAERATRPDAAGLSKVEAELAKSGDERFRRLAVALLRAVGDLRGWTKTRRARLEAYRGDASPLVAGAAAFVFPPEQ